MFPLSFFRGANFTQAEDDLNSSSSEAALAAAIAGPLPPAPLQLQHHELRSLKALELLIETGRARTVTDLIRYAEEDGWQEAAEFLRTQEADSLPIDLAFEALQIRVQIVAHKRNHELLTGCRGKLVGLIFPLPPHLADAFLSLADVTLIIPDGHHLPPHLRRHQQGVCFGSRAARDAVLTREAIVLEAFCERGTYYVDATVTDVLDLRLLEESTQLIVHVRSHRHPEDVVLRTEGRTLELL